MTEKIGRKMNKKKFDLRNKKKNDENIYHKKRRFIKKS